MATKQDISSKPRTKAIQSPSESVEFIVYYQKKPSTLRPSAVLFGSDWGRDIGNADKSDDNLGMIAIHMNNDDQKKQFDTTQVKHSNDLLIVTSRSGSNISIHGESGDGIKLGPNAVIKIAGILEIQKNGEKQTLDGGRHTIESTYGEIKFIICDDQKILMKCDSETNFAIDDESYLDGGPEDESPGTGSGPKPHSKTSSAATSPTHSIQSQSETQKVKTSNKANNETVDGEAPTELPLRSIILTFAVQYIIYYKENQSIKRTVAVLEGSDWQSVAPKDMADNSACIGYLFILLNTGDDQMQRELNQIKTSNDMVIVCSKKGSFVYIYGGKGQGIKVGSDATINMAQMPDIQSQSQLTRVDDKHRITSSIGDLILTVDGDKVRVTEEKKGSVQDEWRPTSTKPSDSPNTNGSSESSSTPTWTSSDSESAERPNAVTEIGSNTINESNRAKSSSKSLSFKESEISSSDASSDSSESETTQSIGQHLDRARNSEHMQDNMQWTIAEMGHRTDQSSDNPLVDRTAARVSKFEDLPMTGRHSQQSIGSEMFSEQIVSPSPPIKVCCEGMRQMFGLSPKVEYILYYNETNGGLYPFGTVIGRLYGQTHNKKVMQVIPDSDGSAIQMILRNKGDPDIEADLKSVFVGDLVTLKSRNRAKIFVYDQQCDGFVIGSGSQLRINAKPFKLVANRHIPLNAANIEAEMMSSKTGDSFHFAVSPRKLICFQIL